MADLGASLNEPVADVPYDALHVGFALWTRVGVELRRCASSLDSDGRRSGGGGSR